MKILLEISIVIFFCQVSFAQNKSDYIWIFGGDITNTVEGVEGSIIDFNHGKRDTLYQKLEIPMGVTNVSISDRETGRLLFYSNGCSIIDSTNNIMENGDDINPGQLHDNWCDQGYDYPNSNSAIILNDPVNEFGYYMIHRIRNPGDGEEFGVFYSYVDMIGNNGNGTVTVKNEPLLIDILLLGSYITACKHQNGQDWWIVMMEKLTNRYLFFLIDENGINYHHDVFIGPAFNVNTSTAGQCTFSPEGNYFAWFNPTDDFNLFDFDRATGIISNFQHVEVPDYSGQGGDFIGDISISPSNQFAYLSSDRQMYQVDLWATDLQESLTFIAEWDGFGDPFPTGFSSIMHGPDCKMYVISGAGVKHLSVIHYPDNKGLDCDFKQHDLVLPWHKWRGNAPNFPHFRIDEQNPCDDQITNTHYAPTFSDLKIKAAPNPVTDFIYFSFPEAMKEKSALQIFNSMGQLVKEVTIKKYLLSKNVDVADIDPGIYYYRYFRSIRIIGAGSFVKI